MKRSSPARTAMTSNKLTSAVADGTPGIALQATRFVKKSELEDHSLSSPMKDSTRVRVPVRLNDLPQSEAESALDDDHNDGFNYALLIALYTLQGIPMGLSASIPFLIQQKIRLLAQSTAQHMAESVVSASTVTAALSASHRMAQESAAARLSYNANAIFALCSWPFSLKLLWAPIVDACFVRSLGRRKSWIVPVQALAGILMVLGANFVERQLGLGVGHTMGESINVKGVTAFFFALYVLMATQDIAVDGWALTMLSKKNRGRGPICNSIGQNIGYFLSFVGFLALNDAESSENLWRPLLGLPSNPELGLVSLGSFIRSMGYFMLVTTTAVAFLKKESPMSQDRYQARLVANKKMDDDEDKELDAAEIGLKETYHRLWAVCKLPSVQWLFLILLTYRLPTSLSDNVKFLKAVEYGLSKSTTAVRETNLQLHITNDCTTMSNLLLPNLPLSDSSCHQL
jgi:MFS transporter, PAT family, solute carrier family 33 (acetyl-CoA transportor), member 1